MMFKQKPVAAAVSMALWSLAAMPAMAQTQDAPQIQTVEVTGIRASLAKSLNVKKNSSANVEVITAEDVGKMPDKNLADSLQRLAGVAVRTDYDEAEKVSMRGTNPDMSLILFNGHTVSGGDWYVADQGSSSRSTSLSLMPSSVLNQAIVYKTSQANIVDGGMAGTINVTTRKPLAQKEQIVGVVSVGVGYAELPGKAAPDLNATVNWKNEADTFGVIVQGFAEKRYIRRDSASRLAYGVSSGWDVINTATMKGITDQSLAGTGLKAADLNGVRMPGYDGTEFVEGVRDRKGGMVSLEFKPNKDLDVTADRLLLVDEREQLRPPERRRDVQHAAGQGARPAAPPAPARRTPSRTASRCLRDQESGDRQRNDDLRPPAESAEERRHRVPGRHHAAVHRQLRRLLPRRRQRHQRLPRPGRQVPRQPGPDRQGLFSTTQGVGKTGLDQGLTYARYGTGCRTRWTASTTRRSSSTRRRHQ